MWLFAILLIVPLIEIALFIEVGSLIGTWPTVAIVFLTAVIGTFLLRQQGIQALGELQARLSSGRDPGAVLAHGAMILVAGILLLTPGFFTDAIGFLLLVPAVRSAAIAALSRRITVVHAQSYRRAPGGPPPGGGQTVEVDYEDVTDEAPPAKGASGSSSSGWTRHPGGQG
ncbi:FxsA family protein [Limibaculum sp. M0105]|uniref:FxsA family protein n=1 Tax=Thermohalobaculum xanthum TaxID=2753746 RepID=A0A8J7MA61_9RHOB|nr:FxsA family protein [Thermohalobaculum xanthum]MBK0400518.1 FxsA family protein [Thermohalobaculum xanthum]